MNNGTENISALQQNFAKIFARLPEQEIEQFYAHYQLWLLRRRVPLLEEQIASLQTHLEENQRLIESLQPSAVALAVLARLQSNGVSDTALLDQMLERGEDWLDRMMQRLDYCEQVEDFIQGDYTQWCVNSLEGAYDWIDTMFGSAQETEASQETVSNEADSGTTAELLLQKLRQDEEEETTLKQPAVTPEPAGESAEQETISFKVAEQFLMASPGEGELAQERADAPEVEEPPELATWTDLEAPPERPAPWYSVNLAEGTSSETGQPDAMNDWIEVLQADTTHEPAVSEGEITLASSPETSQAESSQETGEISAEAPAVQQTESTSEVEAAKAQEALNEPANILESTEVQREENASATPGELPTIEQREAEAGETALSLNEGLTGPEASTTLHFAEETPATASEETSIESSSEHEESPLPKNELEAAKTETQEEPTPVLETEPVVEAGEYGETREAETAEPGLAGVESDIPADYDPVAAAYQAMQEAEHTEPTSVSEVQGVDQTAEAAPETPAIDKETETAEVQNHEIEEAAIVNDILSTEEEHRPWYEYLEEDEQPGQATPGQIAESSEAEKSALAVSETPAESVEQEQQEHRIVDETEAEPASRPEAISDQVASAEAHEHVQEVLNPEHETPSLAPEVIPVDSDATLPMALRDIQRARKARSRTRPEETPQKEPETAPVSASEQETPASIAENAEPVQEAASQPADKVEGEVTPPADATIEGHDSPEAAELTQPSQATPVMQPEQGVPAVQPEQSTEESKKRGFWQRLFGWMRGK